MAFSCVVIGLDVSWVIIAVPPGVVTEIWIDVVLLDVIVLKSVASDNDVNEFVGIAEVVPDLVDKDGPGCIGVVPVVVVEGISGCVNVVDEDVPGCVNVVLDVVDIDVPDCVVLVVDKVVIEDVPGCVDIVVPDVVV